MFQRSGKLEHRALLNPVVQIADSLQSKAVPILSNISNGSPGVQTHLNESIHKFKKECKYMHKRTLKSPSVKRFNKPSSSSTQQTNRY